MNAAAMSLSTGDDFQNTQRAPEDTARSVEIANAFASAIGIRQRITDTTSGSRSKQAFSTAIATPVVVTNIGQLIYNAHKKAEASTLEPELAKHPLIFADSEFAVDPSIRSLPRGLFKLLQAWEGVVVSVSEAEFVAKIRDRTNRDNPEEEVTLPKEDISPSEKDQIVPGAVFYWSIGYKDAPGEPRRRVSQIRFRRLPAWSQTEISMANKYAETLRRAFIGPK